MPDLMAPHAPGRVRLGALALCVCVLAGLTALACKISREDRALGVRCSGPSKFLRDRFGSPRADLGCVVIRVSGPAERAGIRPGDVMTGMNGYPITSGPQYNHRFDAQVSDGHFTFTMLRAGEPQPLTFDVDVGPTAGARESDNELSHFMNAKDYLGQQPLPAIAEYTRAIELAPSFDLAYMERGWLYDSIGRHEEAVADFTRAIALDPDLPETHRHLAWSKLKQNDTNGANDEIVRALVLDKCDSAFTRWNSDCGDDELLLAYIRGALGAGAAIAPAQKSIEFYPDEPAPYAVLAKAYKATGDQPRAEQYARDYLRFPGTKRDRALTDEMRAIVGA